MQQVVPRQRSAPLASPNIGVIVGLLLIAVASALVTQLLRPASLIATMAPIAPAAAVGELVAGRPLFQQQTITPLATEDSLPVQLSAQPTLFPKSSSGPPRDRPPAERALAIADATAVAHAAEPEAPPSSTLVGPPALFFLDGPWVETLRDTELYAAPDALAPRFADMPEGSVLRLVENRPGWVKLYFLGDYEGRQAGEVWVPSADVSAAARPALWAVALAELQVVADPALPATGAYPPLRIGSRLELLGPVQHGRAQVRFPGDGQALLPGVGWIEVAALQPVLAPRPSSLPWAYPHTTEPGVLRIVAPYRSQLDGSSYAAANCGPTVVEMALAAYGVEAFNGVLRSQVQERQLAGGDDAGSYIWAMADVVELQGLRTIGLYDVPPTLTTEALLTPPTATTEATGAEQADATPVATPDPAEVLAEARNQGMHQWTLDEIRDQLRQGHVVVPQVWWRGLPGREDHDYWGDHYIIITGMIGDAFLYNDPVNRDGVGYDRMMSAETLMAAMMDSVAPGAAFAVAP